MLYLSVWTPSREAIIEVSDKGVTCVTVFKKNNLVVMCRANWKDGEASLKIIPIIQI